MPHAQVFVTNGGYGGVLQAVQYGLHMVTGAYAKVDMKFARASGILNIASILKQKSQPRRK